MEEQQSVLFAIGIDEIGKTHLISIAKWNRFMAIVGIVISFLIILALVFGGSFLFSTFSRLGGANAPVAYTGSAFTAAIIFYIIFIGVYLVPCFFRLGFSNKMLKAIEGTDQDTLNESLKQFKIYSQYWGILTIVAIAFYALALLVIILAALAR